MKQYFLILGIIAVLGIFISGCVQQEGDIAIYKVPTIDIEGAVISLYLDNLTEGDCDRVMGIGYQEVGEICPRDRATIKIENIDRTDDPDGFVNLNVGDELEVNLLYSARPAKLIRDILPTCRSGEVLKGDSCYTEGCEGPACAVSSPVYEGVPAEIEDDYIVYHLPDRGEDISETILPGIEENSIIRIKGWNQDFRGIVEYEIIS